MLQLLIKNGIFPLDMQCLFDLWNLEVAESKIMKHSVAQESRQDLDDCRCLQTCKNCLTRGAHEHVYRRGEWLYLCVGVS